MTAAFTPGQRVRIVDRDAPGHVRTPVYARGRIGVIERVLPRFLNPEREAHGVNAGTEVRLYRVRIRVHDSNANMRYLVMPMRPPGTDGWTEDQLATLVTLVTRDSMIGVSVARTP